MIMIAVFVLLPIYQKEFIIDPDRIQYDDPYAPRGVNRRRIIKVRSLKEVRYSERNIVFRKRNDSYDDIQRNVFDETEQKEIFKVLRSLGLKVREVEHPYAFSGENVIERYDAEAVQKETQEALAKLAEEPSPIAPSSEVDLPDGPSSEELISEEIIDGPLEEPKAPPVEKEPAIWSPPAPVQWKHGETSPIVLGVTFLIGVILLILGIVLFRYIDPLSVVFFIALGIAFPLLVVLWSRFERFVLRAVMDGNKEALARTKELVDEVLKGILKKFKVSKETAELAISYDFSARSIWVVLNYRKDLYTIEIFIRGRKEHLDVYEKVIRGLHDRLGGTLPKGPSIPEV
jgi:hypothetical protein